MNSFGEAAFDVYQQLAERSSGLQGNRQHRDRVVNAALGLSGESGEVCDLLKKHFGHGHELNEEKLAEELGDLLWYVAEMASAFGLSLGEIAAGNIAKLRKRYPEGFSQEASRNR